MWWGVEEDRGETDGSGVGRCDGDWVWAVGRRGMGRVGRLHVRVRNI